MTDDFELVPEKDFDSLKRDVDELKSNPIANTPEGKNLKDSVDRLNDSINKLFNLFKMTADSLKGEEKSDDKIQPLAEKIDRLADENEKIARGIVTLADMVEDIKRKTSAPPPPKMPALKPQAPPAQPFGPIPQGPPPQTPPQMPPLGEDKNAPFGPPTQGPPPLPRTEVPKMPPPPEQHKKRGLFGFGK